MDSGECVWRGGFFPTLSLVDGIQSCHGVTPKSHIEDLISSFVHLFLFSVYVAMQPARLVSET